jgi:hypothetical protein
MEEIVALIDAADEPKKHGPYRARQPAEISKLSNYLAVSSRCNLGKFRHSGRQLEHVVHNQRSSVFLQASPVLRAAMASTGEADCGHAGGEGGIDTSRAVLDDETAIRRRRQVPRGI